MDLSESVPREDANIRSKKEIANTWKSFNPIGLDGTLLRPELNSSIQQQLVIFEETNRRRNLDSKCKVVGDSPILMVEAIAIREAILTIMQKQLSNVIIE